MVEGVGPIDGNLSHFDMVRRWEQGDLSGSENLRTGFLGRLVDGLGSDAPMVGLSVAGYTPRFTAAEAGVLSLNSHHQLNILTNDDWIYPGYREALRSFTGEPLASQMAESWQQLFAIGDSLSIDAESLSADTPLTKDGGNLGRQLQIAAGLINTDIGVRVVHAHLGGFDTHEGHQYRHADLMGQLDAAVHGFFQLLEAGGAQDRVLVATTSEFGRRVGENNAGLDHGAASTMLMLGPIGPRRLGEPSPLDNLDDLGNLVTTVGFDRYLATLAQSWMGVEAASLLPNAPEPFALS